MSGFKYGGLVVNTGLGCKFGITTLDRVRVRVRVIVGPKNVVICRKNVVGCRTDFCCRKKSVVICRNMLLPAGVLLKIPVNCCKLQEIRCYMQ